MNQSTRSKREDGLPESPVEGLVPTMNNTGWMTVALDDVSAEFARYAGTVDGEVLDIGCAYGIATLEALDAGARVCACDRDRCKNRSVRCMHVLAIAAPVKWRRLF